MHWWIWFLLCLPEKAGKMARWIVLVQSFGTKIRFILTQFERLTLLVHETPEFEWIWPGPTLVCSLTLSGGSEDISERGIKDLDFGPEQGGELHGWNDVSGDSAVGCQWILWCMFCSAVQWKAKGFSVSIQFARVELLMFVGNSVRPLLWVGWQVPLVWDGIK